MEIYGVDPDDEVDPDDTDQSCSHPCGEILLFDTEVFLLTVTVCSLQLGQLMFPPSLDVDGDFMYEPCFFCFTCWESLEDEIRDRTRDTPPITDDYAIMDCMICESGIRRDELVGTIQIGELVHSSRTPDDKLATRFQPNSLEPTGRVICIACLNILNVDIVDTLWTRPVTQLNECPEGTAMRCWRHGCTATNECSHVKEIE